MNLLQLNRLKVPHLRPCRPSVAAVLDQVRPTPRPRRRVDLAGRVGILRQARTRPAGLPTPPTVLGPHPLRRYRLRFAFAAGGSADGGVEEFVESLPNRARNEPTSASNAAIRAVASSSRAVASFNRPVSSTTNSANCSYDAGSTVDMRS